MEQELLSNSMAAQSLSEQLQDKTAEQWAGWLQNNRNQSRTVPYRIPFERVSGGVFYARDELDKFIEFEKQRLVGSIKLTGRAAAVLHAYGTGTSGGTRHGRQWKGGSANLANDNGDVFVQAVVSEPLTVFRMTAEQAIEFGTELVQTGKAAERQNNVASQEQINPPSGYEVVTDNQDARVMRKGKK